MRVLITGAGGFVGRNLTYYLTNKGYDVIALDIRGTEVRGDITDPEFTLKELIKLDFDAIVHLAALTNIPSSIRDPFETLRVNSVGTLNVAELALRKRVVQTIYASTANVYGNPASLPVKEDVPRNPRTPYDYSKCIAELILEAYSKSKGLPITILRSWKLFGEWDSLESAVSRFIIRALQGLPLELYNRGLDVSDFTYIMNYCRMVELALERATDTFRIYNVGTGNAISVKQLAMKIVELIGSTSPLVELPPRDPLEGTLVSYPSIDKARQELGYEPIIGLDEGLRRTIGWVKATLGITR
jgi:nucleoside-diphosphate-sugar epimerase